MAPIKTMRNILMELRKVCQHPYLSAPDLEKTDIPDDQQQRNLINGSGKLVFLKLLLPKLKERGHRVLLFSQFKIALDRIEDFLYGEGYKFLRLDGDVQQAQRQKSMDAFNAPDSDYFIFLLTTRAGGVGINLATADTVIIFDPDFNPHMDLQAIARSHRYGQKNKVLVFKLMTKNSVEEKIIWAGKKKMVLDHLVVQQMGKENEEGDIDSMLLHGAKALYEADADGVAPSDIIYNSKNVDELIDKVEQEAEAEAKALEAREAAGLANGTGEGENSTTNKAGVESMSFAFAKIWETGQNQLQEVEEEEENADEMAKTWQEVMDNAERERLRLKAIRESGAYDLVGLPVKRMRKNVSGQYQPDNTLSDDSPSGSNRKKGKGKAKASKWVDTSDPDFTAPLAQSESDDDSIVSAAEDIRDLFDDQGKPILTGLVGEQHGMKKKRRLAIERARIAEEVLRNAQAMTNGVVKSSGPSSANISRTSSKSNSPTKLSRANETPEERAIRKAAKRARRELRAAQMVVDGLAPDGARLPSVQSSAPLLERGPLAIGNRSSPALSHHSPQLALPGNTATSGRLGARSPLTHEIRINEGRSVVQWLYAALREFGLSQHNPTWATMSLPELPVQERKIQYLSLAGLVDDQLRLRLQDRYFTQPAQQAFAFYLIESRAPVLPEDENVRKPPPPPANSYSTGRSGFSRSDYVGSPTTIAAPAAAGPLSLAQAPDSQSLARAAPTSFNPTTAGPPKMYRTASGQSSSSKKGTPKPESLSIGLGKTAVDAPSPQMECEFCSNHHEGLCPDLAPMSDLLAFEAAILASDEPEDDKRQGLAVLERMMQAHREAERLIELKRNAGGNASREDGESGPSISNGLLVNGHVNGHTTSRPLQPITTGPIVNGDSNQDHSQIETNGHRQSSRQSAPAGSKDDAIVVDDDSGDEVHATRPSWAAVTSSATAAPILSPRKVSENGVQPSPGGRGRSKHIRSCQICGSTHFHSAIECPIVRAGPQSITNALRRFPDPTEPMHQVLQQILSQKLEGARQTIPQCAYCLTPCGRSIRECVEAHGGRKLLKDRIRRLEAKIQNEEVSNETQNVLDSLYGAYRLWPKPMPV